jgi:hypothetical protein
LDIHDVDARPHDFGAQFINRGGASQGTILTTDFVREGDEARYVVTVKQDTDLPRRLSLNFADMNGDQQNNTVISQRPLDGTDATREQSIDLTTYVASAGDAQKFADRWFRRQWNQRESITLSLTAQHLAAEPGDAFTLSLDGVERYARLTKWTLAQGRINAEFVRDALSLNALGTGTGSDMDGRDEEVIYVPGPGKAFVLDIPLLTDSHSESNPLLYYGAGVYAGNFPGAIIWTGTFSEDEYDQWNAVDSADKAVWGLTNAALGDCDPHCWDRSAGINVTVYGGTLTSCTEAEIDADPTHNMAVIGSEVINFATATLESDGTYTLTSLKRGRRGTEWACADHVSREDFVLVTSLDREGMGLSDVGSELLFKGQTVGRDPVSAPVIEIDPYTGATLKPYAPARVKWVYDGTDLLGTITRRTRVGGSWPATSWTVPLSENSEAYEVDVMDGDDVLRTITVTGTNEFTYTAAMAAADGVTLPTPPDINAYQISDAVGRGFALAA